MYNVTVKIFTAPSGCPDGREVQRGHSVNNVIAAEVRTHQWPSFYCNMTIMILLLFIVIAAAAVIKFHLEHSIHNCPFAVGRGGINVVLVTSELMPAIIMM